ncbi:glycosyltransferase [Leifsonia aquatica]|uniref:CDP-glycerol:poly(Glycerophosphate) glycerophosphotransferase n=2 Tax=Leifsonia aquatica TaxID=144185 RepID=U2TD03_LEIAQ|nr:glycosyltransferase [Leifsonia aquatica]ERK72582.1 CDP-glycerol:poly(glycerophosphate) glycerophosphotransferase [Leifsonia aquatica ATCC 14665]MBB2967056.1 CDP-glycerol glycerophosphotransferase (TagB/SpsB family)/glycosyltransferase involved in cell wall biosynthesis [Leifsonia aquatica]
MRLSRLKRLPSRVKRAARFEIHAHWRRQPLVAGSVFYESFSGNGMLDNPEAVFRALLDAPDLQGLTHIWALSDLDQYRSTVEEFAGDSRVSFVRYGSAAYYRALATSEYLVNNATFPPDFSKRPGQVYLNTWHGTPLKRMGYDIEDGALGTANIIRNFVQSDYLLSANPFMSEQMYESAYKLTGIYRGAIVEEGYPRIDRQFLDDAARDDVRARLVAAGIPLGDRKVVLYAPTWKGATFGRPTDDLDELLDHIHRIEEQIDTSRYAVLLKTHQSVHKLAAHRPELQRLLVPNEIPTNLVLGVSDLLISDYSSIFFDFLQTGRPIVFFTPDLADYAGTRGLYFEPEEWPGPVYESAREVGEQIARIAADDDRVPEEARERYASMQERFTPYEDGHAAERVVDIVFRRARDGYRLRTGLDQDGRRKILLYLGGMRPNGITTSALNLLNNIDHDRYDVSALFSQSRSGASIAKQKQIHPAVRQFPRVGGMNGAKLLHLARHLHFRRGRIAEHAEIPAQNQLWDDEWYRCFGESRFDYVVDFSGYGPFWAALLLHSPDAQRAIWLHNDLAADAHREVNGEKKMLHSLTQIFTLYGQYDHLVSVSPTLSDINRESLAEYAAPEKFLSALNTVDADHILENAQADLHEITFDDETGSVPDWAQALLADDDVTTFVNVGRLSPEKNQGRLVRAFAAVHAQNPKTRLVIVGDGPLAGELEALIAELGLDGAAFLTGMQRNPHAIMAKADCFVLSSDYEGQPMVILEALVLGLPIVTVEFASAKNALPAGSGLVVPQTDEGVADGLRAFLAGGVPDSRFDYAAYNRKAVGEFYRAIGAAPVLAEQTP